MAADPSKAEMKLTAERLIDLVVQVGFSTKKLKKQITIEDETQTVAEWLKQRRGAFEVSADDKDREELIILGEECGLGSRIARALAKKLVPKNEVDQDKVLALEQKLVESDKRAFKAEKLAYNRGQKVKDATKVLTRYQTAQTSKKNKEKLNQMRRKADDLEHKVSQLTDAAKSDKLQNQKVDLRQDRCIKSALSILACLTFVFGVIGFIVSLLGWTDLKDHMYVFIGQGIVYILSLLFWYVIERHPKPVISCFRRLGRMFDEKQLYLVNLARGALFNFLGGAIGSLTSVFDSVGLSGSSSVVVGIILRVSVFILIFILFIVSVKQILFGLFYKYCCSRCCPQSCMYCKDLYHDEVNNIAQLETQLHIETSVATTQMGDGISEVPLAGMDKQTSDASQVSQHSVHSVPSAAEQALHILVRKTTPDSQEQQDTTNNSNNANNNNHTTSVSIDMNDK